MQQKLFSLFSKISYAVVIASFLMPFILVKCANEPIATATGIELISGKWQSPEKKFDPTNPFKKPKESAEASPKDTKPMSMNIYAIAILALGVVGLVASFLKFNNQKQILMGVSLVGIILLIVFAQTIDKSMMGNKELSDIDKSIFNTPNGIVISMQEGFYACLIGFVLTFIQPLLSIFKDTEHTED